MGDFRQALRFFRHTTIVTLLTIGSLALGIGVTSALFSVANGLLFSTLPVPKPDWLAILVDPERDAATWIGGVWHAIEQRPELFVGAFAWQPFSSDTFRNNIADPVSAISASGGFFRVLDIEATLGRTFDERDESGVAPEPAVAVISHEFWQRPFDGSCEAIAALLPVNGVLCVT